MLVGWPRDQPRAHWLIAHELLHGLGFAHDSKRFAVVKRELRHVGHLPNGLADDLRAVYDTGATVLRGQSILL